MNFSLPPFPPTKSILKVPSMFILKRVSWVGDFFSWSPTLTWQRGGKGKKNMKIRGSCLQPFAKEVLQKVVDRSHYQEKSSAPEIKGAANPQMYHSNGLKILTLDLRGLGRDRESEARLDFSGSSEIWKAVRPGCSLKVLIWNAPQK